MSAGCVNARKQSAQEHVYVGGVKQQQYHSVFIDI